MKKFILLLFAFAAFATATTAQTVMTGSGDSVVNAATKFLKSGKQGGIASVSFQVIVTKGTGTVAGFATLEGSLNDTNYVAISTDSLLLTDAATNTYIWTKTTSGYLYYRIKITGSGTMKAYLRGLMIARKPD